MITGQTTLAELLATWPDLQRKKLWAMRNSLETMCPGAILQTWTDLGKWQFRLWLRDRRTHKQILIPLDPSRTVIEVLLIAARHA